MQIILLAAGRGLRLGNKTATTPKTLLPVGGKPVLLHILQGLARYPEDRIVVVGGFEFNRLGDFLSSQPIKTVLVRNTDYEKGNLLSLLAAQSHIHDAFCLMNSDHVFSRPILEKVFQPVKRITAVCDFDRTLGPDDMKIVHRLDGTLGRMEKTLPSYDGGYIGITIVPKEKAPIYWKGAWHVRKTLGEEASVEKILNILAEQGELIDILDVSGHVWFEVDREEDLAVAEKKIRRMEI